MDDAALDALQVVRTLVAERDFLRRMDDGQHIHLVRLDVVNDPVRAFQDFSNLRDLKLGDDAPRQGEFGDLLGAPGQTVNDA